MSARSTDRSRDLAPLAHVSAVVAPRSLTPARDAIAGERDVVWATLYERHFDDVYRLVRRAGVRAGEAEDVTQRTFLRVHELLAHTQEIVHPLAWLRAVTVRVVAEYHRFWRVRRVKHWIVEQVASRRTVPTPLDDAQAHEAHDVVADVLARMSPKLRDVLVLVDLEELAPAEVATILGIPVNTVRSRRHLARAQFTTIHERRHGGRA